MSRTYEQLEPVIMALDDRIGAKADAKAVGEALEGLEEAIAAIGFTISVDANGNAVLVRDDMVNTEEVNY